MAEDKPKSLKHKKTVQKMSVQQLRAVIKDGTLLSAAALYELVEIRHAKSE